MSWSGRGIAGWGIVGGRGAALEMALAAVEAAPSPAAGVAGRLRAAAERMRHDARTLQVPISVERRELFLAGLRAGISVSKSCRAAGIAERTAYRERARNEVFAREWAEALEAAIEPLEERLEEIAYEGDMGSMATVRAAETLLRGRSRRYANHPAPQQARASLDARSGTIAIQVGGGFTD